MTQSRIRPLLAGLALATAPLVAPFTAAPALAAGAAESSDGSAQRAAVSQAAATSEAEESSIEKYWTAERMASAVPAKVRFDDGEVRFGKEVQGKPLRISRMAAEEQPQPEHGKVYFTLNGTDYVCSGTATQSGNADVVTTAGHCVNEGPGEFATNFAFVPAYDDGDRPYGTWTAERLYTTKAWSSSGDFEYDVGFAVMNENDSGQSLTEVVGSIPIGFNMAQGLKYTSYGYPAGTPYNGQQLYSCTDTAEPDPYGSSTQGITCDMTGGSSGGGWITGGVLNGLNSYKYVADPTTMYGPYFGDVIKKTYQKAASA